MPRTERIQVEKNAVVLRGTTNSGTRVELRVDIAPESTSFGRRWSAAVSVELASFERSLPFGREFLAKLAAIHPKEVVNVLRADLDGRLAEEKGTLDLLSAARLAAAEFASSEWSTFATYEFGSKRETAVPALEWTFADVAARLLAEPYRLGDSDRAAVLADLLDGLVDLSVSDPKED